MPQLQSVVLISQLQWELVVVAKYKSQAIWIITVVCAALRNELVHNHFLKSLLSVCV